VHYRIEFFYSVPGAASQFQKESEAIDAISDEKAIVRAEEQALSKAAHHFSVWGLQGGHRSPNL
jgi:hypothetical protein